MRSAVTATAGPDESLTQRLDEAAHQMGISGEEGPGAPSRVASTLAG
jgi:hypothetical protein